jgi:DNA-binding GntR family transcriptional regulator
LRILEDRGLVLIHSNKGASVADFTARDIRDVYFLRVKLESVVCMLAFHNLTAVHVNEMRQLQKRLKETSQTNRELVTIHESFHDVIFRAADNEFLRRQIKRLISLTGPIRYFSYTHAGRRRLTVNQHDEIIAAIEKGDKKKFVGLCLDHLSLSLEAHLQTFHPTEAQELIRGYRQALAQSSK